MTTLTDTQVITASGGLVELGYSQITSTVTVDNATAGTGKEVIAPLTVVCDGNPILIEFYSPNVHAANTVDDHIYVSLFMDGAEYTRNWGWHSSPAATYNRRAMLLQRRITPSAGSHTFSVRAYVTNASRVGYVAAGSGGTGAGAAGDAPAFLRVSKIVQATQWPAVTTGTIICTSSTRPASPFEGQRIYQTDDKRELVYNGSAWVTTTPVGSYNSTSWATSGQSTTAYFTSNGGVSGPEVTVQTGTKALVTVSGRLYVSSSDTRQTWLGFEVSGASSISGSDANAATAYQFNYYPYITISGTFYISNLVAGSNTFKTAIKRVSGDATMYDRHISVTALP